MSNAIGKIQAVCQGGQCAPQKTADDQSVPARDKFGRVSSGSEIADIYECPTCGHSWEIVKRDGIETSARRGL